MIKIENQKIGITTKRIIDVRITTRLFMLQLHIPYLKIPTGWMHKETPFEKI